MGGYVNMAFQKSDAELNGYDEAVVLTASGHVNEASAANLFIVRDGVALTPPVSDDLLEGVTRKALMELLANEGIPVQERSIDRSELYVADEVFLCGTGVQISPVIEVDHRPVGSGQIGPIGRLPCAAGCPSTATGCPRSNSPPRRDARAAGYAPGPDYGASGGCRSGVAVPMVTTTSARIALSVLVVAVTPKACSRYAIVPASRVDAPL